MKKNTRKTSDELDNIVDEVCSDLILSVENAAKAARAAESHASADTFTIKKNVLSVLVSCDLSQDSFKVARNRLADLIEIGA